MNLYSTPAGIVDRSEAVGHGPPRRRRGRHGPRAVPRRDDRLARLDGRLCAEGHPRRGAARHPRSGRVARHPPGLDPAALRGARARRVLGLHRPRHQRPDDVLRHRARRLSRGRRDPRRRGHLRDRAQRDGLHRAAPRRVRRRHPRGRDQGRVGGPALPPGRPLPDEPEEDEGERREGDRRHRGADRGVDPGRLPADRHRHLDARGPLEGDPRGAAARQRRPLRALHEVHPRARAARRCRSRSAARSARSARRTRRPRSSAPT